MARRLRLPSLSALTRAYQRNLKTLTRAMRSAQRAAAKVAKVAKTAKTTKKPVKTTKTTKTAKTAKAAPRATAASQGDWIAGVATGPAGARRFHLHIPPGLALRPREKLPLLVMLHGCDHVVSPRNGLATAQLWAQALGAKASATTSQQRGKRYPMQVTPFKRQGRTVVELRDIAGLGHAWSGGGAKLAYSDPAGPDASALTWAFAARAFKQQSSAKPPQQK